MNDQRIPVLLRDALADPVRSPGSEQFAGRVLRYFPDVDLLLSLFAEKAEQTLADRESRDRTAISPDAPHLAVLFVAWYGTFRELQPRRYGQYLSHLFSHIQFLEKRFGNILGLLQIDAYVRHDNSRTIAIAAEYSFCPGSAILANNSDEANDWLQVFLLNPDLCDNKERQALETLREKMHR